MTDLPSLRVLVADEQPDLVAALGAMVREAGHEAVACGIALSAVAAAVERERPDVAVVGVHDDPGHALDLLDTLRSAGDLPVIAALDHDDELFLADAAERDLVAQAAPLQADGLANAIRVAWTRAKRARTITERLEAAEEQLRRRAVIERAKGVLMERHGVAEPQAYAMLRDHARNERQSMTAVAESVLRLRPLLPRRHADE
jgi:AmiR/NasT family two-component response regulator